MTGGRKRGVLVLLGGPDQTARASVAAAIAERASADGWRAERLRYQPRPQPRRLRFAPFLRWAVIELIRYQWRSARTRGDVVIAEASWYDVLLAASTADPHGRLLRVGRVLWPLVPRADVVAVLDSRTERERPDPTSHDWQPWMWHQLAPWMAARVVAVKTQPCDAAAAAAAVLTTAAAPVADPSHAWAAIPVAHRPRHARATAGPGSAPALAMTKPVGAGGRVAVRLNQLLIRHRLALPEAAPVDGLVELCRSLGVEPEGLSTVRLGEPGRRLVGVAGEGRLQLVLKLGLPDDAGLAREAAALVKLSGRVGVAVPVLRWAGAWRDRYVVATEAVEHQGMALHLEPDDVVDICLLLSGGGLGGDPVVHGDFTPWNLLATPDGLLLIDWEEARFGDEPLFDLTHFVVKRGNRGHRCTPDEAVATLTAPGSAGWRYLEARGDDPKLASELVCAYLREAPEAGQFHQAMLARLTG